MIPAQGRKMFYSFSVTSASSQETKGRLVQCIPRSDSAMLTQISSTQSFIIFVDKYILGILRIEFRVNEKKRRSNAKFLVRISDLTDATTLRSRVCGYKSSKMDS